MTAVRETAAALCGKMLSGIKQTEQKAGVMYHHDDKKKKKHAHVDHEKVLFTLLHSGFGVMPK